MSDNPIWIVNLQTKKSYLTEWLSRNKAANEVAPIVQMNLELTNWQIECIQNRPSTSIEVPDLSQTIQSDVDNLNTAFPLPPKFNKGAISTASALTSIGVANIIEYTTAVGHTNNSESKKYYFASNASLKLIHDRYDRPKELQEQLSRLGKPNIDHRIDEAIHAFNFYATKNGSRVAAATSMRNLICGVKGELWNLARAFPNEDMTWQIMSERLTVGGKSSSQYLNLLQQENIHSWDIVNSCG